MWFIHTMKYYSDIKGNEVLTRATIEMNLEGITLSARSQSWTGGARIRPPGAVGLGWPCSHHERCPVPQSDGDDVDVPEAEGGLSEPQPQPVSQVTACQATLGGVQIKKPAHTGPLLDPSLSCFPENSDYIKTRNTT